MKSMKKSIALLLTAILLLITGCTSGEQVMDGDDMFNIKSYTQISQEQAKEMMAQDSCLIWAIRTSMSSAAS